MEPVIIFCVCSVHRILLPDGIFFAEIESHYVPYCQVSALRLGASSPMERSAGDNLEKRCRYQQNPRLLRKKSLSRSRSPSFSHYTDSPTRILSPDLAEMDFPR